MDNAKFIASNKEEPKAIPQPVQQPTPQRIPAPSIPPSREVRELPREKERGDYERATIL